MVAPAQVVALVLPNSIEFHIAYFAVLKVLAAPALLNPALPYQAAVALGVDRPSWTLPAPYAYWLERDRLGAVVAPTTTSTSGVSRAPWRRQRSYTSFVGGLPMRLEGKIAIVTGAVQGMGRGIADRFVKEGALVAIVDYKSAATALLDGQRFYHGDVSDPELWKRVVSELLNAHGRIDVLVNNAAIVQYEDGAEPPSDRCRRSANGFWRSRAHAPRLPARLRTATAGNPAKRACGGDGLNYGRSRLMP
jgi:hypothetical protein